MLESYVFVAYPVLCFSVKISDGIQQACKIVLLVDGHDFVALGIIGRMQAQRQVAFGAVVGKLPDHFGNTGCTDGDAAGRHIEAVRCAEAVDAVHDIAVRQQRFPHTHIDHIGERVTKRFEALPVDQHHLIINFGRIEIAQALHAAGGTKGTGKAATYLRRNTDGEAVLFDNGYKYRFYQVAVVEAKAGLDGTVRAMLHLIECDGAQQKTFRQAGAQRPGQVGHLVKVVGSFFPQPLIYLTGAKARFPPGCKRCLNVSSRKLAYIQPCILSSVCHHAAKLRLFEDACTMECSSLHNVTGVTGCIQ